MAERFLPSLQIAVIFCLCRVLVERVIANPQHSPNVKSIIDEEQAQRGQVPRTKSYI